MEPKVYLSRTEWFSAAHCLRNGSFSEKKNKEMYGKCSNMFGHGHNYKVKVTLYGPVDAETGMVVDMEELKSNINNAIMDILDHKHIDEDVAYFKNGVVSTVENICVFIWNNLVSVMKKPTLLYEVKIHETMKNSAIYRGDN